MATRSPNGVLPATPLSQIKDFPAAALEQLAKLSIDSLEALEALAKKSHKGNVYKALGALPVITANHALQGHRAIIAHKGICTVREVPPPFESNGHAGAQTPAPAEPDELVVVRLSSIKLSPSNPRKRIDEEALAELAQSIRDKGVLQPVLLRPHPQRGAVSEVYELVVGERRVRASGMAGKLVIPAIVRHLDDRSVLEIQVIENEQREDVSPLEKADGYARLVEQHGASVEDLAAKVGKSVSTIRGLLKLRQLPDVARTALENGELQPAVAGLIARVAGPEARAKAAAHILKGNGNWHDRGQPFSYREAKRIIEENYTVELKSAPFNRKALDLVPAAGSCDDCPKRVGNLQKTDPENYRGARADVCTDPDCYHAKVKAWQAGVAARAKEKGQQISTQKAEDLAGYRGSYFDLAEECWQDRKGKHPRSYKQLLEGHIEESQIVLAYDGDGELRRLVHKDVALPILRKEHKLLKESYGEKTSDEQKRERARTIEQNKITRRKNAIILAAAAKAAEESFQVLNVKSTGEQAVINSVLRALVHDKLGSLWGEVKDEFYKHRGLGGDRAKQARDAEDLIVAASGPALMGMLAELYAGRHALNGYSHVSGEIKAFTAALGLPSPAEAEKKAREQLKREKEAKGNGKKPMADDRDDE